MLQIYIPALLAFVASAAPSWIPQEFRDWAAEHSKSYRTEHAWQRAASNYAANTKVIEDLNSDPNDDAEYGHTRYSDLSPLEFHELYFPAWMDPSEGLGEVVTIPTIHEAKIAVDWRQQGAVTSVKDQGHCGSCWAHSAVGNMESMWYLAHNDSMESPVSLSVQQVIECDPNDHACYTGFPKGAYKYVIDHGGLAADVDYPYNVERRTICLANQTYNATCGDGICDDPPLTNYCDATCSDKSHKSVAQFTSWRSLPTNEDQIAAFLAANGPVSVGVDATGGGLGIFFPWLQFYRKGIANPRRCSSDFKRLNHGVLLVGYGEENGQKYWIVKNSYGPRWGEEGYFRIVRGESKCGVNLMASSAVAAAREIVV